MRRRRASKLRWHAVCFYKRALAIFRSYVGHVLGSSAVRVRGAQHMTDIIRTQKKIHPALAHHRLIVWQRAVELVKLVQRYPIADAELRGQANRAARSAGLNIVEGAAVRGAAKERHFVIAQGSVTEVVGAYELAEALGEVLPVAEVQHRGAEVAAMLFGLMRRRPP